MGGRWRKEGMEKQKEEEEEKKLRKEKNGRR